MGDFVAKYRAEGTRAKVDVNGYSKRVESWMLATCIPMMPYARELPEYSCSVWTVRTS